jgi:hypothetical protein
VVEKREKDLKTLQAFTGSDLPAGWQAGFTVQG